MFFSILEATEPKYSTSLQIIPCLPGSKNESTDGGLGGDGYAVSLTYKIIEPTIGFRLFLTITVLLANIKSAHSKVDSKVQYYGTKPPINMLRHRSRMGIQ
ncbi:MAG: hypothetical protein KKF89_04855 [Nanoarchaeota archaeon]|nr:hypothetical protein [Nanoarchaeota archaeon]